MLKAIKTSVRAKFITIMLLTLIGVNGPLLFSFFVVSTNSLERKMLEKKSTTLDINSKALGKPLWDFDYDNVKKWADSIAQDRDIASVEILDYQDVPIAMIDKRSDASTEPENDSSVFSKLITHTVESESHNVGTLRITFYANRIGDAVWDEVQNSAILFVVSAISVLAVALIANRAMIVIPLERLNSAMESSQDSGKVKHVTWDSEDDFGKLTRAFNDLQDRLEQDRAQLVKANKRHVFLYNNTPAMLFSVDNKDFITRVSEHWLRETGYRKDDVVGVKFSNFIGDDSREAYSNRIDFESTLGYQSHFETFSFRRKDGAFMDVLLTETRDFQEASGPVQSLSVMTDISKLKQAESQLKHQAQTDIVTGLLNRAGFAMHLDQALCSADDSTTIAVLFFDLDRFKWVNDNLGHPTGDEVLKIAAARVKALIREGDHFGRFGGDEFAVMLAGKNIRERTVALAKNINETLFQPISLADRAIQISASIGISFYPNNASDVENLLKTADVAMYRQKKDGRNGFCIYDEEFGTEAARQLEIEEIISEGLRRDWFKLFFQPVVDLDGLSIVGFEGLLRLMHPEKGIISPAQIFEVAELSSRSMEIGDRVLELACEALDSLSNDPHLHSASIAINLSADQFQPNLPEKIASHLAAHNLQPERLVLEITETILIQENPGLYEIFDDLITLGCSFSLDDFGTGYSSLSYINRFPVSTIKIDQSFVRDMQNDSDVFRQNKTIALIEAIISLSNKLNFTVIAEGIETELQLEQLSAMGVDAGQGYLFSPARPIKEFAGESGYSQIINREPGALSLKRA